MKMTSFRIKPIRMVAKVFPKISNNKNQYNYYSKLYKQRNDSKKLLRLFWYFVYKTIREYTLSFTKIIVNTNGYKIKTIPDDKGISEELRIFKIHEPLTTRLIGKIVNKGMHCVDLGCNLGYYALLESKLVGEQGKIFAFEPMPLTYNHFKENIELNNASNVQPYNIAVGHTNGKIKFMVSPKSNWCRVTEDSSNVVDSNIIDVPIITLDSFATENNLDKIDFIRMDIEGFEDKAYSGMSKVIKKFRPSLYMEIHPSLMGMDRTSAFFKKLKEDGYEIKYFTQRICDTPWICDPKKDIMKITLDELTLMLPEIYGFNFSLFLVQEN